MGTLIPENQTVKYQWASDVNFDGIRLEVLSKGEGVLFDVSVGEDGSITVNTFGREVSIDVIRAALALADRRQSSSQD